jgi:hypothetical protein
MGISDRLRRGLAAHRAIHAPYRLHKQALVPIVITGLSIQLFPFPEAYLCLFEDGLPKLKNASHNSECYAEYLTTVGSCLIYRDGNRQNVKRSFSPLTNYNILYWKWYRDRPTTVSHLRNVLICRQQALGNVSTRSVLPLGTSLFTVRC